MGEFISHVPSEHVEARRMRSANEIPPPGNGKGSYQLINGRKWNATVLKYLNKSDCPWPCKEFTHFRGGRVQAPLAIFRQPGCTKFWTARAYCKVADTSCLKFKFTLIDFELEDEFVCINVQSEEGSSLLTGTDGLQWHVSLKAKWDINEIQKIRVELASDTPLTVLNRYLERWDRDKENVPHPGPIRVLERLSADVQREKSGENHPNEEQDIAIEIQKQKDVILINSDAPIIQLAWTSAYQMKLIHHHVRSGTAYIDTTSKVVRNAPPLEEGGKPRPFVYGAMVVKTGGGVHSLPVSEMLTTAQDTVTATSWLMRTRQRYHSTIGASWSTVGPFFKTVVVDDSWPLIHAVLVAFNHENVTTFLGRCWALERQRKAGGDQLESMEYAFQSLTAVHICAFHAIRRVRSYVARKCKRQEIRKLVANAYRALLRTKSMEEAMNVVILITQAFGRRKKSAITERAAEELERLHRQDNARRSRLRGEDVNDADEPDVQETQVPPDASDDELRQLESRPNDPMADPNGSIYKSSPYYGYFHEEIQRALTEDTEEKGDNPFYVDKDFIEYLEAQHLAFMPMLNRALVIDEVSSETLLLTTNYVEKWFALVKTHPLEKKPNWKRGAFFRKVRVFVSGHIVSLKLPARRPPRPGARPPTKATTAPKTQQNRGGGGRGRRGGSSRGNASSRARSGAHLQQTQFLVPVNDPSQEVDHWGGIPTDQGLLFNSELDAYITEESTASPSESERKGKSHIKPVMAMESRLVPILPGTFQSPDASNSEANNVIEEVEIIKVLDYDPDLVSNFKGEICYQLEGTTIVDLAIEELPNINGELQILDNESEDEDDDARDKRVRNQMWKELNTMPPDMLLQDNERDSLRMEAITFLNIIKSSECEIHLQNIMFGKVKSARMNFFKRKNLRQGDSGFGPLNPFEDLIEQFLTTLDQNFPNAHPFVKLDVLIPEAIIYAYQVVHECSYEEADEEVFKNIKF